MARDQYGAVIANVLSSDHAHRDHHQHEDDQRPNRRDDPGDDGMRVLFNDIVGNLFPNERQHNT